MRPTSYALIALRLAILRHVVLRPVILRPAIYILPFHPTSI